MKDSDIIELFFERSEEAIMELSKKYGRLCLNIHNVNTIPFPIKPIFTKRTLSCKKGEIIN